MEVQLMSTILFLLFSPALLLSLSSTTAAQSFPPTSGPSFPPTAAPAFPPSSNIYTDYIRSSCESTRYPETCFTTLFNYSDTIRQDPSRLATVAIHVALHNATHMSNYVTNISRQAEIISGNTTESAAIGDCSSVIRDTMYQMHKSIKEMRRLGLTGESVRFQLSNVQTWMSAALTNEDTCMDGFAGVAEGAVKTDVCERVVEVMEVTSNALALVNMYADTVSA